MAINYTHERRDLEVMEMPELCEHLRLLRLDLLAVTTRMKNSARENGAQNSFDCSVNMRNDKARELLDGDLFSRFEGDHARFQFQVTVDLARSPEVVDRVNEDFESQGRWVTWMQRVLEGRAQLLLGDANPEVQFKGAWMIAPAQTMCSLLDPSWVPDRNAPYTVLINRCMAIVEYLRWLADDLALKATDEGWCERYNEVVDQLNGGLTFRWMTKLRRPKRAFTFTVEVDEDVSYIAIHNLITDAVRTTDDTAIIA